LLLFPQAGAGRGITWQDSQRQVLAELELGACFGEEALLADRPRNASVTLLEDSLLLRLDRQDFVALLKAPVVDQLSWARPRVCWRRGRPGWMCACRMNTSRRMQLRR